MRRNYCQAYWHYLTSSASWTEDLETLYSRKNTVWTTRDPGGHYHFTYGAQVTRRKATEFCVSSLIGLGGVILPLGHRVRPSLTEYSTRFNDYRVPHGTLLDKL